MNLSFKKSDFRWRHDRKTLFYFCGTKFLSLLSLGQWSKIDLNQFCSIVPGTKSACLLGISLAFCPMKQKLKPWDTHFFSCVGGMEHVALHQREKNFSCPQALRVTFSAQFSLSNLRVRVRRSGSHIPSITQP